MSLFVQPEDFKQGSLTIAYNNITEADLQECINSIELDTITDLLGCSLGFMFISDYTPGVGFANTRFKTLFEPFATDTDFGPLKSEGIKEMLKGFIYFEYVRNQPNQDRQNGLVNAVNENSTPISGGQGSLHLKHNRAANTYSAIQCYVGLHADMYPEFKGVLKKRASWI